jgi:hypothetical protein
MPAFPHPVGVRQRLEQAGQLLVLADDRLQEMAGALAAREAGTAVGLLVEVREDRRGLVEQSPDSQAVDVHDDVPEVRQGLERRPLAVPRRCREALAPDPVHGLPHDQRRGADAVDDGALDGGHPSCARTKSTIAVSAVLAAGESGFLLMKPSASPSNIWTSTWPPAFR